MLKGTGFVLSSNIVSRTAFREVPSLLSAPVSPGVKQR